MKKYLIITAILGFSFGVFSQEQNSSTLKKANKHYDDYSYSKAIDKYSDSQDGSTEVLRKLAESFYKTGNIGKSEVLYGKLVNGGNFNASDVYMYSSTLMQNQKYPEAKEMMEKYKSMSPSDTRATNYLSNPNLIEQLKKDKGQFEVRNLDINSPQEDFSPVFYDGKVLFASSREGVKPIRRKWNWNKLPFLDIYQANKADNGDLSLARPFTKKLNKKYHEGPVCFNKDESLMAFTRNNYEGKSKEGIRKLKIFTSSMQDGKWANPKAFPLNSSEYSVGHPTITNDGKWMYFASDMPGGFGGVDLYKIPMTGDGTYGEAINLGESINTQGNEMFPNFHESGLLLFSSDGQPGLGGLDIFAVQVSEDDGKLGKMMNIGAPVNSSRDDFSLALDSEMKSGYFASNREDGNGDDDIYYVDVLKPLNFGKILQGVAKDKKGNVLADTEIELLDENANVIETVITGENGDYSFTVDGDKNYKLKGAKDKYFDGKNTADTHTDESIIYADLELEKDPGLSLYALVTDKKSGDPLENVKLTIIDNLSGKEVVHRTPLTGDYRRPLSDKKINDRGSYNIKLEKPGYFTKVVTYNTLFAKPGVYEIHNNLDLTLDKEVKDLSEMIQINPINFDFNKYNIRPDAQVELNKIVEIMNRYPGMVVELGSHTDCRGSNAYNEKLSDRRAKASAKYIKGKITSPERIYGKGYGENRLLNECNGSCKSCSDEEHDANRRTEFKVISTGNDKVNVKNTSTNSFDKK